MVLKDHRSHGSPRAPILFLVHWNCYFNWWKTPHLYLTGFVVLWWGYLIGSVGILWSSTLFYLLFFFFNRLRTGLPLASLLHSRWWLVIQLVASCGLLTKWSCCLKCWIAIRSLWERWFDVESRCDEPEATDFNWNVNLCLRWTA